MAITPVERNWRAEFEIPPEISFLNHASFGPVTVRGRRAVESLMDRWGRFAEGEDVDDETFRLLIESRTDFARLIGADEDRVAFAPNTSYGLNAVLWGLPLKPGERILISEAEFPAAVYVVQNLAAQRQLEVEPLPCQNGCVSLDSLEEALRRKPAVLVLAWVQYFNGYRYDLEEITRLCHEHGCFVLVDGMQGVGAVPIDARAAGFDALACGCQKWLFGQTGSGFFYISPDAMRPVTPPYAGWLGVDWSYRFFDLRRWDRPAYSDGRRWEVGTYPFYSLRFAHEGLRMLQECGGDAVWEIIQRRLRRLAEGLSDSQYRPLIFPEVRNRSGIVVLPGPDTTSLHRHLQSRKVLTALREGNIRVSPHFHTTETEIDRLLDAVREFEKRS